MVLAGELITALLLGFVAGRIWQIRQQLLFAEQARQRSYTGDLVGAERSPAAASDLHSNARPILPAATVRQTSFPRRLRKAA
jgi:hypothetical protein